MKRILTACLILTLVMLVQAQYNEDFAKEVFYIALLANCKADKVLANDCGPASKFVVSDFGMEVLHAWKNEEGINGLTTVIVKKEKAKTIYVGLSGTKHMAQLVADIVTPDAVDYTLHSEAKGAQVMKYFNDKYTKNFRVNLIDHIKEVQKEYPNFDIIFTGHSLGAGMATLALADYSLLGLGKDRNVYGYTFGQPRVANYKLFDAFLPKVQGFYRVVHENDIVAHVPPCIVDSDFNCKKEGLLPRFYPYHPPEEIWYNEDWTNYSTCDIDLGEDPKCSDKGMNDSLRDHVEYFNVADIGIFIGGDY
ncbi:unnamed protein product [Moneuplotes crassus]|uniref:Fungal lipase-type domain-containing protein n=1 Tax=Euplotes crassus TaxID=5936 RepID=A0AAD1XQ19_EUPCR|nr:unnamed protein product [Moneuplotes crassus]